MLFENTIFLSDCITGLQTLPDNSINCCVTSPPYYGLRDYGVDGQIGLEETPELYVAKMVEVFREVKRVLKKDGTLWLNLGDSYWGSGQCSGHDEFTKNGGRNTSVYGAIKGHTLKKSEAYKPKDLIGIPWMLAFALRADGWYLRQDLIWHKPNPMPESVTDRCTKSHEYIFLLSKSAKYYYDADAIKEETVTFDMGVRDRDNSRLNNTPGRSKMKGLVTNNYESRNKRSVWTVTTKPFKESHFATFPEDLISPCVLAGCPEDGIILDPFMGAGTTALVARKLNRNYVGFELNPEYKKIAEKRLFNEIGIFA